MEFAKLRGRIKERYHTEKAFAQAMGMSPSALSMRLNSKTRWIPVEICRACNLLGLSGGEHYDYFFECLVEKSEH